MDKLANDEKVQHLQKRLDLVVGILDQVLEGVFDGAVPQLKHFLEHRTKVRGMMDELRKDKQSEHKR